jgi:uncharacterized membrane protein YgcG
MPVSKKKKTEPLPPYDPYSGTVSAPGKNQLPPPFHVTDTVKGPVLSKELTPNSKLAAAIKRANAYVPPKAKSAGLSPRFIQEKKGEQDTKTLINALQSVIPKPAGLTPEFIAEQKRAATQRAAIAALGNATQGGGGGGSGTKSKKSSKGGGGTSTPAAPAGPSVTDLLNDLYDKLLAEIDTQATSTAGDYDATKATITNQYTQAQKDLYAKYQATMNPLAEQAANLGVDYQNSSIDETADAAMKRLQETGDLSLASDQSYLDKMKLMQQGAFGALKTGSLQEKADAQLNYQKYLADLAAAAAAKKSGGGGGGRKGGGSGGGSGAVKSSATSTGTSIDTGINALLTDLAASGDYETLNNVQRYYDIAQGGGLAAATKDSQFTPSKVPNIIKKKGFLPYAKTAVKASPVIKANKAGTKSALEAQKAREKLRSINKGYGNPIFSNIVKNTAKG